jgi:hypothetical protein
MAHPNFDPTFHPSFLSTSHAYEASLISSPVLSLTLLLGMLRT